MTTFALEATDAVIRRGGVTIVPNLSLQIPAGSLYGLIGPSGSGKTTIMRAIVGLGAIHAGRLDVMQRPAGSADLRQRIGYLPQNGGVWPDLTAREALRFMASIYGAPADRIDELLALTQLDAMADRPIATLSGGQERRVALAMALINRPEFLVLDEPTVGLDPRLRALLWREFRSWADAGSTVVISTHVMDEAERCDDVAIVLDGRVVATGSPAALVANEGADTLDAAVLRIFEREDANVR